MFINFIVFKINDIDIKVTNKYILYIYIIYLLYIINLYIFLGIFIFTQHKFMNFYFLFIISSYLTFIDI